MSPRPNSYADALRGRRGAPAAVGGEHVQQAGRGPRLLLRPLWRYVPVLLGGGILWHLYVHGLQPAWSEHRRLAEAHSAIAADNTQLRKLHRELLLTQEALEDPHYQERRRRWRAERLAARARLPDAEESRPADLAELARLLAAGAGSALAEEHTNAADSPAPLTVAGTDFDGTPSGIPSPSLRPAETPKGIAEPPLLAGPRAAPAPSGVR